MDEQTVFHNLSSKLKAISDPKRIHIMSLLLRGERTPAELSRAIGVCQPTLSYHMKVLCGMGLTICRKEGIRCFYRLDTSNLRIIGRHFEEIADYADQLQRGDPASMTIPAPPALLTGKVKNLPF